MQTNNIYDIFPNVHFRAEKLGTVVDVILVPSRIYQSLGRDKNKVLERYPHVAGCSLVEITLEEYIKLASNPALYMKS